jgi:hypothetical protein
MNHLMACKPDWTNERMALAKNLLDLSSREPVESLWASRHSTAPRYSGEARISVEIRASRICGIWRVALLIVAHGQLSGDRFEIAEQAACAVVGAGGEIEFRAGRTGCVVAARDGAVSGTDGP